MEFNCYNPIMAALTILVAVNILEQAECAAAASALSGFEIRVGRTNPPSVVGLAQIAKP